MKDCDSCIKNANLLLFKMSLTVIIIGFLLIITMDIKASPEPPEEGDWLIEQDEDVILTKNQTMLGNLTIDGTLTIDGNYTLEFDCYYFPDPPNEKNPRIYYIYVNNTGKLSMKNGAIIKAKVPEDDTMLISIIRILGNADIQNSEINGLYNGLYCEKSSNVTIINTTFRNCIHAIVGRGVQVPHSANREKSRGYQLRCAASAVQNIL